MQSTLSRRNGSTHIEAELDSEQHEPLIAENGQEQENEQVCIHNHIILDALTYTNVAHSEIIIIIMWETV